MLDVRQAEQLVFTAGSTIPALELDIEQEENFISLLLGRDPGPVPRGRALTEQRREAMVPPGLPSSLLERRPDIVEAEHQLIAANARIGAARALYFPQISLTGAAGYQSSALTALFATSAGFWTAGASLAQPIFNAGRLRSNVRLAEAQQQEAALIYEQTIRGAFRDVSDALIAYRKTREVTRATAAPGELRAGCDTALATALPAAGHRAISKCSPTTRTTFRRNWRSCRLNWTRSSRWA